MDKLTINALMERLGCQKYPERWNDFYCDVANDIAQNGCILTEASYYDELHEKYGVIGDLLDIYKQAADEIKKDPDCTLFLALLRRAMLDRALIRKDLASLDMPHGKEYALKYAAIPSLIMCEAVPRIYNDMKARAVPEDILRDTLAIPETVTKGYMSSHNGEVGFSNFDWHQLFYDGRLFRIKRLQLEFPFAFLGLYKVFENKNGDIAVLSHNMPWHRDGMPLGSLGYKDEEGSFTAVIEETEDAYIGYPYNDRGGICKEKITLNKDEWKVKLQAGDHVVSVHIPRGPGFDDASVQDTLDYCRYFLDKCYPDYENKAFFCASWLLDRQLIDLLGDDSNIAKFCKRYTPMYCKSEGMAAIRFVFHAQGYKYTLDEVDKFPEATRLERAQKKHYSEGKAIYEPHGFFF